MKKILLSAAFVAALTLGSCSGSGSATGVENASDFKSKVENCTNPDSLKAYVTEAQAYVQKLVDEGKLDQAKKYLDEIEPVVQQKAPKFAGMFETVKSLVDKVPSAGTDALDKANEAASVAGDSISSAAESVKEVASDKIEDLKDAAADKVSDVKDAVAGKVSDVKDAVADKAAEAKEAVSEKAADAKAAVTEKANDLKDAAKDKVNNLLK